MQSVRGVRAEIANTGYMRGVLETYEEIAATRMQKVRGQIWAAKVYYQELAGMLSEVGEDIVAVSGETKTIEAIVLLSSHSGMFGDLGPKVVASFVEEVKNKTGDVFVIGEMGAKMVSTLLPDLKFRFMSMPNEELTPVAFSEVVNQLRSYRKIKIFYGEFVNIARQEASARSLSAEMTLDMLSTKERGERERLLKYLYEPSVSEVGQKLSTEVFANVFDETLRQSQLAKFAARLMHLDNSLNNLELHRKKLQKIEHKARKILINKKQGLRVAAGHWSI